MLHTLNQWTHTQVVDRLEDIDRDPTIEPDRLEQDFIDAMVWRCRRFHRLTQNQRRRAELIIERYGAR